MLWEAWLLAKAYRKTPSELYFIRDELAAWSLNRAVWFFGTEVENEMRKATEGAKSEAQATFRRQSILTSYGILDRVEFRDPAAASAPQEPKAVSSTDGGSVSL